MELRLNMTTGEKEVGGVNMTHSHINQDSFTSNMATVDQEYIIHSIARGTQAVPTLEHQVYPSIDCHKDPTSKNILKSFRESMRGFDPDTASSKELILYGVVSKLDISNSYILRPMALTRIIQPNTGIINILLNKYMDTLRTESGDEFGIDDIRYIDNLIFKPCNHELRGLNEFIITIINEAYDGYEVPEIQPVIDYTINSIKDIIVVNTDTLGYLGDNEPSEFFKELYEIILDYIDIYTQLYTIIVKGINTKV